MNKLLYIVLGILLLMSVLVSAGNNSASDAQVGYTLQQTWLTQEQVQPTQNNTGTFIAVIAIIIIYKYSNKK